MCYKVHYQLFVACILLWQFLSTSAIPCDSCGNECFSACGTKHFRTCCFNYLRKRTDPNALKIIRNKKLIDFIMLEGRELFTQNESSDEKKQQHKKEKRQQQEQQQEQLFHEQQQPIKLLLTKTSFPFSDEEKLNRTFILEDLQAAYYD